MRRRQFLGLLATSVAAGAGWTAGRRSARAAVERSTWWRPAPGNTLPPNRVVLEWRYLAGRITAGAEDFGFVVSLAAFNSPLNDPPQLLVKRQDFSGAGEHRSRVYTGFLAYESVTASYTFVATDGAATVTWRYDAANQTYTLNLVSPEVTLANMTLVPQGDLIPEGGGGEIAIATFGSVDVRSDYYADWVAIRQGNTDVGTGRLDMQTIRPTGFVLPTGFSHHWFALAAEVSGAPVWISAWRLVSDRAFWAVTIARGSGATWNVEAFTETSTGVAYPLTVELLTRQQQPVPIGMPPRRTGRRWRLTAGRNAPGDVLDVTPGVPEGQFITGARVSSSLAMAPLMQEAIGDEFRGVVQGQPLNRPRLIVAESTFSEPANTWLPLIRR